MRMNEGHSTPLRHRPTRTIPALVVGLLMLASGVALVWLTIWRLAHGFWPPGLRGMRNWLTALDWADPGIWMIGAGLVMAGVVLVLCAAIPGGFGALKVAGADGSGADGMPDAAREIVMTRRGVAHLAKAQCLDLDGVGSASATATAKHVQLHIRTPLHDQGDLGAQAAQRVRICLEAAGLEPVPRVSATVTSTR